MDGEIDFAPPAVPLPKEQLDVAADARRRPTRPYRRRPASAPGVLNGLTTPADLPSSMLVDKGVQPRRHRLLRGLPPPQQQHRHQQHARRRHLGRRPGDFDSLFVPGDSYRSSIADPRHDRSVYLPVPGHQRSRLPRSPAAGQQGWSGRWPSPIRKAGPASSAVASFPCSLTDPRLITVGLLRRSGFSISVPTVAPANGPSPSTAVPTTSIAWPRANLAILESLFPKWTRQAVVAGPADHSARVGFDVGKVLTNIDKKTKILFVSNDQTISWRRSRSQAGEGEGGGLEQA